MSKANRFELKGNNFSAALNNYKNNSEEVLTVKWFDDFWVYLEIRFEEQNTFITISIFQGEISDNRKNQLFRGEWDDYNNPDERHPQPHWHITSHQAIENTFSELIDKHNEQEGFAALILSEEKSKVIDVNKIHFPMIGNWMNDEGHIHSICDNEKMVKWFQGFFSTMRKQLEYVK